MRTPSCAASRRASVTDPHAQYAAETAIRDRQLAWLAVYHSHPGGGIDPSPLDVAFASRRPTLAHVIVAVDRKPAPDTIAAFRTEDDRVMPIDVRVTDRHRSAPWQLKPPGQRGHSR